MTLEFMLPCSQWPVRRGDVSNYEWSAAELFMQAAYRWDFMQAHTNTRDALALSAGPRFFESSYFEYLYRITDTGISMPIRVALTYILTDFMNPLPMRRVQEFERAYRQGKLTPDLLRGLMELITRPGGLRKPDILGIIAEKDPGLFDLHEVCTVGTISETKKESSGKLDQLRRLIPMIEGALASRQSGFPASTAPLIHHFEAGPSDWTPRDYSRVCPLGVDFDQARNAILVKWACFEPSVDPTASARAGKPVLANPGILPYHIHQVEGPKLSDVLPAAVRVDLKRWEGELARARGMAPLQLLPELNPAVRKDLQGMTADGRRFLAYGSLAVTAVVFCIIAFPIIVDVAAGIGAADVTSASTAWLVSRMHGAVPMLRSLYMMSQEYAGSLSRAATAVGTP